MYLMSWIKLYQKNRTCKNRWTWKTLTIKPLPIQSHQKFLPSLRYNPYQLCNSIIIPSIWINRILLIFLISSNSSNNLNLNLNLNFKINFTFLDLLSSNQITILIIRTLIWITQISFDFILFLFYLISIIQFLFFYLNYFITINYLKNTC